MSLPSLISYLESTDFNAQVDDANGPFGEERLYSWITTQPSELEFYDSSLKHIIEINGFVLEKWPMSSGPDTWFFFSKDDGYAGRIINYGYDPSLGAYAVDVGLDTTGVVDEDMSTLGALEIRTDPGIEDIPDDLTRIPPEDVWQPAPTPELNGPAPTPYLPSPEPTTRIYFPKRAKIRTTNILLVAGMLVLVCSFGMAAAARVARDLRRVK